LRMRGTLHTSVFHKHMTSKEQYYMFLTLMPTE
jgi:hypothetical protein